MTIEEAKRIKLSENFNLWEFLISDDAIRYGLLDKQLEISELEILRLKELCQNVLQPLRNELKVSIRINSGYRCFDLNERVNGVPTSDHLMGLAADIYIPGKMLQAFQFIKYNCSFKQLGDEHNLLWIHVSYDKFNKKKEIFYK